MVSKRILNMKPSATSTLAGRILALKASGAEIVAFNVGEPDFPTPAPIVEACARAMAEGRTKYTEIAGIPPLREAIAEKLRRDNTLEYAPEQICVSVGAKQAVYNAVQVLCDPGDEVIIPTPCWVSYVEIVRLAGAVPVLVPTTAAFHLDMDRIAAAITPRTRLVLLNTPNNPTGFFVLISCDFAPERFGDGGIRFVQFRCNTPIRVNHETLYHCLIDHSFDIVRSRTIKCATVVHQLQGGR